MECKKVLEIVLREMKAYGRGWRNDWSEFDGRYLRNQLNELALWAVDTLAGENDKEFIGGSVFELSDSQFIDDLSEFRKEHPDGIEEWNP